MATHPERFQQLQRSLSPGQAIILSTPTDLAYFAQFQTLVPEEREGFFIITSEECYLVKASFSPAPEAHSFKILNQSRPFDLAQHLRQIITDHHLHELCFDFSSLFVEEYLAIQKVAAEQHASVVALEKDRIWQYRMIKDNLELEEMHRAGHFGEAA